MKPWTFAKTATFRNASSSPGSRIDFESVWAVTLVTETVGTEEEPPPPEDDGAGGADPFSQPATSRAAMRSSLACGSFIEPSLISTGSRLRPHHPDGSTPIVSSLGLE